MKLFYVCVGDLLCSPFGPVAEPFSATSFLIGSGQISGCTLFKSHFLTIKWIKAHFLTCPHISGSKPIHCFLLLVNLHTCGSRFKTYCWGCCVVVAQFNKLVMLLGLMRLLIKLNGVYIGFLCHWQGTIKPYYFLKCMIVGWVSIWHYCW